MSYEGLTNEQLENLVLQRDAEATLELANRCRTGSNGQEINLTRAYQLYHRCEKMNMIGAFKALGDMYANGEYVAQNMEIANEYYAKAGIPLVANEVNDTSITNDVNSSNDFTQQPTPNTIVDLDTIGAIIAAGETSRTNGDTASAFRQANEAINLINTAKNNGIDPKSIHTLEMDAYWLMAFTSFNVSDYAEMEKYINIPGVTEKYPWGIYLCAIVHMSNGYPANVLEADLNKMLIYVESPLLKPDQIGDMYGMIADLYNQGVRTTDGNPKQLAKAYYEKAAAYGSTYAQSQLKNMN